MFIPIAFESVNHAFVPEPGRYSVSCSLFADRRVDSRARAFLFEYTPSGASAPTICDLVVFESQGAVRARDFVFLSDRSWRDSDGAKAEDLAALFPQGLFDLRLVRRDDLKPIVVGVEHHG